MRVCLAPKGSKRIFYRSVKLLLATSTSTVKQANWAIGTVSMATCGQACLNIDPASARLPSMAC